MSSLSRLIVFSESQIEGYDLAVLIKALKRPCVHTPLTLSSRKGDIAVVHTHPPMAFVRNLQNVGCRVFRFFTGSWEEASSLQGEKVFWDPFETEDGLLPFGSIGRGDTVYDFAGLTERFYEAARLTMAMKQFSRDGDRIFAKSHLRSFGLSGMRDVVTMDERDSPIVDIPNWFVRSYPLLPDVAPRRRSGTFTVELQRVGRLTTVIAAYWGGPLPPYDPGVSSEFWTNHALALAPRD